MRDKNQSQRPPTDVRMDTELEADPMLTLSEGKASGLQIASVALAIIAIVAVVAYGLSQP
jgi:hypothetical protein